MNFQLRKHYLLTTLEQHRSVSVVEAAQHLNTTPITIRRDLAQLAKQGLVVRTHGGAVLPGLTKHPVAFARKADRRLAQKQAICRLAAAHITEGDFIYIDCGSTTFGLCALIRQLSIRVLTNSLPVLAELAGSAVQLVVVGGEVDRERQAMHGATAVDYLARYSVDKAFVGTDGLSVQRGLSANSEQEATITRAAMAAARHVFLLCDSSKLEQDKYLQFAPLSAIGTLITDQQATAEVLARYRESGVTVLS
ncbi:DeoR/GlpR family DNA-binding transcription regulator [Hymenobacter persicinus]|uniref:DeoR/GlpR transcriptional regulator n=1 Tax=Hymenobacter persicinus TaxID=2025506 RepID=A0A4Q5L775_9BACT|nr:DeoR/GlpR family DNA-binding transcription regulator [Hymenobacter persicinus]RYU75821.1 DeoR/GlpR transcriptional regulator [Hymenobacter persicinus]